MKDKNNADEQTIEISGDKIDRISVPRDDSGLSNVAGVKLSVKVILECEDFDVAVDAIRRVDRAWNGQLNPPNYSTEARAFIIAVSPMVGK
jgi:hypothetical protein